MMGSRIEWSEVPSGPVELAQPGEFKDACGSENDMLALGFGEGSVVEGTAEEWEAFAIELLVAARAAQAAEDEAAKVAARLERLEGRAR